MNNLAYSGKAGGQPGCCPAGLRAEPPRPRAHHRTSTPAATRPVGAARRGRFRDAMGNSAPPSWPFTPRSPPRAWRCRSSPGRTSSCLAEARPDVSETQRDDSPAMFCRAGDLSRIPGPHQRLSSRYLLHQTTALLPGSRESSPVPARGAGNSTNKLQGEKAAAAGAAWNRCCRTRHREAPTAKAWPR